MTSQKITDLEHLLQRGRGRQIVTLLALFVDNFRH